MRQRILPALFTLLLANFANPAARAATVNVTVSGFSFNPSTVNISVGDTVTWTGIGAGHTVTANDGSFRSGDPGEVPSFSHTFNSAGSFGYHCEPHQFMGMVGTVNVAAAPTECVPSATTLCLDNGRFQVEVDWRAGGPFTAATAIPLEFAPESGLFYFSSPGNIEMLVKVLNACVPALGNKYWVFYAATTNLEFVMTVIDTQTGAVKVYHNPENTPALPVQDTSAFATCP
ncbi:MAG: plastocyanin/azurin family copper-binding protein [Thermoanaerobaculia bacterium]